VSELLSATVSISFPFPAASRYDLVVRRPWSVFVSFGVRRLVAALVGGAAAFLSGVVSV